jgi:hypothetical protein
MPSGNSKLVQDGHLQVLPLPSIPPTLFPPQQSQLALFQLVLRVLYKIFPTQFPWHKQVRPETIPRLMHVDKSLPETYSPGTYVLQRKLRLSLVRCLYILIALPFFKSV